jgi:hypothetical protein
VQTYTGVGHSDKSRPPRERVYHRRQCTGVASEGNTVDEVVGLVAETEMRDETDERGEARLREYSHRQHRIVGAGEVEYVPNEVSGEGH